MWYIKYQDRGLPSLIIDDSKDMTIAVFFNETDARKMEALLYETKDSNIFEEKDDEQI